MAANTPSADAHVTRDGGLSITKIVVAVVILGLAAWFIFANTHSVSVQLWVAKVTMPMWIMLLVTFFVGWGVGLLFRRKKAK